jgi:hypothetical protein
MHWRDNPPLPPTEIMCRVLSLNWYLIKLICSTQLKSAVNKIFYNYILDMQLMSMIQIN